MKQSYSRFTLAAGALLFGLAASSGHAATQDKTGQKMMTMPDLTKSCASECPDAKNNDQAFSCVEKLEKQKGGDQAFKKSDRMCYEAHEKYEAMKGTGEKHEQAAGTLGDLGQNPKSDPYRYG